MIQGTARAHYGSAWWRRIALTALIAVMSAFPLPLTAQPVSVRSDAGHFTVQLTGLEQPEPLNRMHGLELRLTTPEGKPVTGAVIGVTGTRRYTSNPLPTAPKVSAAPGPGRYRVAGLRFHMPGEWRLVFDIEFAQNRDRATFEVMVK